MPVHTQVRTVINGRLAVAYVVAVVVTMAACATLVGYAFAGSQRPKDPVAVAMGHSTALVSMEFPPMGLILMAICGILLIAVTAIVFEAIAALLSISPQRRLLSSYRTGTTRSATDGKVRVTVLIPAHNGRIFLAGHH